MSQYQNTESDREGPLHLENPDQDVETRPYPEYDSEEEQIAAQKKGEKQISAVVVCSCGSIRCGAIGTYGHPRPVYTEKIEPIGGQYMRDREALRLKGIS